MRPRVPSPRTVLFLQGPPSTFWADLARGFEAAGHRTRRINLNLGDWLYWRKGGAANYRGRLKGWEAYLAAFLDREGVTDILYYADRLPYHVVAARLAAERGIRAVAVEFGYLRPDWITLERDAMGTGSHFPRDPDRIRAIAAAVPPPDLEPRYPHSFGQESTNEVVYNLTTALVPYFFPLYRADKYYHPLFDYLCWLPRLARQRRAAAHAAAVEAVRTGGPEPYFLLALQMQSDYQIRANSPYRHMREMIAEVVASFARRAPRDAHLVLKIHPLDNGWENWPRVARRLAAEHGVPERVEVMDGGHLDRLLARAAGVLVINSTVGLYAIRAGRPTKVLGVAVFDVPGLTHQGPLDDFWTHPEPVDRDLADAFVRALAGTIQVKGNFYHAEGRALAIREIVRRVGADAVNEPGGYEPVPPRLAAALAAGVPYGRP